MTDPHRSQPAPPVSPPARRLHTAPLPSPMPSPMPSRVPGTALRILASNDLLATFAAMPTTYGHTGSIGGIQNLLERERQDGPTLWLDSGDLSGGALRSVLPDWPAAFGDVPIDAAAAGNHEFDTPELLTGLDRQLPFPLLCADRDTALAPSTVLATSAGAVGVVGLSHPDSHILSHAPARRHDWAQVIREQAMALRLAGARWVIALWHNGATWTCRSSRVCAWEQEAAAAASNFDLILGGHTLSSWTGTLHGVPAGHAHAYAGSVLIVDLPLTGLAHVHAPHVLDAASDDLGRGQDGATGQEAGASRSSHEGAGRTSSQAVDEHSLSPGDLLRRWQSQVVGHLPQTLTMRPGESNTLGDFVAASWLEQVAEAEAAFVPACELWTQPPVDGTVAALPAGAVSQLDLRRLFPFDGPLVVVELRPGQWETTLAAHNQSADFVNTATDSLWWNWARGRAGTAQRAHAPRRVVTSPFAAQLLTHDNTKTHTTRQHTVGVRASDALMEMLQQ